MRTCCEFSRKVFINQIQKKQIFLEVEANAIEREALAQRFSIPDIALLTCHYQLAYHYGGHIRAIGKLKAKVDQKCVVTLEDFSVQIEEDFELLFMPLTQLGNELEEIEDPDIIPYEGDSIDLGEVTAQQLVLLLDPYPHKPDAHSELIVKEETIKEYAAETKDNPFKILEKLKNKEN